MSAAELEDHAVVVNADSGALPAAAGLVAHERAIVHRPCDCCDGEVACVRGVVAEEGKTVAVYFATFTIGHPQVVRIALGLSQADGPPVLFDMSIVGGELVVERVDDEAGEDVAPFVRYAEAIRRTDELVRTYLSAPRESFIRQIR